MKFNPKDWSYEFQQRGGNPLLLADIYCQALFLRFPDAIKLPVPGFDYLMTSENKGYYRKGMREAVLGKFKEKIKDENYLKYILDQTLQRAEEFSAFMEQSEPNIAWDEFIDHVLNFVPWFYIPWYVTEFNLLSDLAQEGLKKHKLAIESVTDLNNAAMLLMFPEKEMEFQKEQAAFYELVGLSKSGINLFEDNRYKSKIQDYLKRFDWLKTYIITPLEPLSSAELKEKIAIAIRDKSDVTYAEQKRRKAKDAKIVAELNKILEKDKPLLKKLETARNFSWLLTYSVEKILQAFAMGIPWYKKISETIGLDYKDWVCLTIEEVAESLKQKKCVITAEELLARKAGYVFAMESGRPKMFTGEIALEIIKSLGAPEQVSDQKSVKEIKGKPACSGKVVGKVRVSLSASDVTDIEVGAILVCAMTSPDYVPAMKRSGAIVTDEGGLLCHAAIMSRELGKPCVIATRIATKVLKDGDLVEVDAGQGIVKILNK